MFQSIDHSQSQMLNSLLCLRGRSSVTHWDLWLSGASRVGMIIIMIMYSHDFLLWKGCTHEEQGKTPGYLRLRFPKCNNVFTFSLNIVLYFCRIMRLRYIEFQRKFHGCFASGKNPRQGHKRSRVGLLTLIEALWLFFTFKSAAVK